MTTPLKPFAHTPGRDTTLDRPATFDVARSYYDERARLAEDAPLLRRLMAAVNHPGDLDSPQWAQWYAVALSFAPDLILELGRGYGNSTAVFAQAALRLGARPDANAPRVVSICGSGEWTSIVAPRLRPIVGDGWFASVDALRMNILAVDYEALFQGRERVLVLWDAHGYEIAELVLGDILPRLASRDHLVLMHDISDNRYHGVTRSYERAPLWKGIAWQERTRIWDSRVNIGWMNSQQDQVVALADFAARNDLEIGSADHEFARFFAAHPECANEMRELLGAEFFSLVGHWAFLSLTGRQGPFHFPALGGARGATHRAEIATEFEQLPATVVTSDVPWAYAATVGWRPSAEPPADADAWIRCRVRVERNVAGVSVLSADEQRFVDTQVVSPTRDAVTVLLKAPKASDRGRLVVHTWDAPGSARVLVEELALVW